MNELQRLIKAGGYSLDGLRAAYRGEPAFRLEVWMFLVGLVLASALAPDAAAYLALMAPLVLLMIVELVNSAIEAAIDRIGQERHELSRNAKDFGSAAVLLASLLTAAVWGHALWLKIETILQ